MPMKEASHLSVALFFYEHFLARFASLLWDSSFGRNDKAGLDCHTDEIGLRSVFFRSIREQDS